MLAAMSVPGPETIVREAESSGRLSPWTAAVDKFKPILKLSCLLSTLDSRTSNEAKTSRKHVLRSFSKYPPSIPTDNDVLTK